MTADAEHFFDDGKAPPCFLTNATTKRRVHYWGPYRSKLTPAEAGLRGLSPSLTGDFLQWIILDAESRHLIDGLIAGRNRETPADKADRLKRAKERAEMNRIDEASKKGRRRA